MPTSPGENGPALRALAERYTNVNIAKVMGVSETAVRNWSRRHGITRKKRLASQVISDEDAREIKESLSWRVGNLRPDQFLFGDHLERLPNTGRITDLFVGLSGTAGLERIRVHDLRHSFGSIWAQRVPLAVVKAWMGHSSVTTTERYVHTNDETFRRWVEESQKEIGA